MGNRLLEFLTSHSALLIPPLQFDDYGRTARHHHIISCSHSVGSIHHDIHVSPIGDHKSVKTPIPDGGWGAELFASCKTPLSLLKEVIMQRRPALLPASQKGFRYSSLGIVR